MEKKLKDKRWLCGLLIISIWPLWPICSEDKSDANLVLYGGKFTDTTLLNIVFKQKTDYMDSWLAVAAINYPLEGRLQQFSFETEAQVVQHFGIMKHTEWNALLIARWPGIVLSLPFSVALGEGLSVAARKPRLEEWEKDYLAGRKKSQKSSLVLNYIMLEMDFPLWTDDSAVRGFIRIHHRSGVFGTYCPPTCGSNFVAYGFKFKLP